MAIEIKDDDQSTPVDDVQYWELTVAELGNSTQ